MNWEDSKACTPLKRDVLNAWFAKDSRYFLTGGSALGLFYLHHRLSYDLDLFTTEEVSAKEVQTLMLRVADEIGAHCESLRTAPDFHRFKLTRNQESELIDIVVDRVPQIDPEKVRVADIRVDTQREILANKLTTLLSRAEIKDLVDLYFLEQAGLNIIEAIPDAQMKDGGWDAAMVSLLLETISFDEMPVLLLKVLSLDDLKEFTTRLRLAIGERALP